MIKVLMMAAFVGLLSSSAVAGTFGDDKGKKDKKEIIISHVIVAIV